MQRSQHQNWKANKYSILTVTELGLPVSESSIRILKFDFPIDSKHKFNKTEIENQARIQGVDQEDWSPPKM